MAAVAVAAEAMEIEVVVEAVVWDTDETAARRTETVVEEQPELTMQWLVGVATRLEEIEEEDAVVHALEGIDGEGANGEEIGAQSKIFSLILEFWPL